MRYLDFAAGIAVNSLGHVHPHVTKALITQAKRLWHTSNLYQIRGLETMAERLVEHTFADTVFFCNSGAEAIECGIKMIRKYFDEERQPDRYRIITFTGAFHGRTLATVSAGEVGKNTVGFEPLVDGFDHVEFGNIEAVKQAITPNTAAILIEPIQGEGGIRAASSTFLKDLRNICDQKGLLLFFDEIQCGMGRTGKLFAHELAGVTPDIMAVAKGIGNGFPLGACLATGKVARSMKPGSHGSTYGSNPLAMAVGNAVLDVILEEKFLDNVRRTAVGLKKKMFKLAKIFPGIIEEIRGTGLMLGIKPTIKNIDLVNKFRELGLLTVPASDNVVRILPPLNIKNKQVNEAVTIMERALVELSK